MATMQLQNPQQLNSQIAELKSLIDFPTAGTTKVDVRRWKSQLKNMLLQRAAANRA
jgi:hypothetical protein